MTTQGAVDFMEPSTMTLHRRKLLICFDAFGTLFRPREPVPKQYTDVARSLGLQKVTEEQVAASFKTAFKNESRLHPNYGKANGMNAEKWWRNPMPIFKPLYLLGEKQVLPPDLVPRLLHRFWSEEGYELEDHVKETLHELRHAPRKNYDQVVVGVITNSDPRVPDVLSCLGLKVNPLRYGAETAEQLTPKSYHDVDFSVMSYDAGYEKPDARIFLAAEQMLDSSWTTAPQTWDKIYVGDEYDKDVVGARNAGWYAVLIGKQGSSVKSLSDRCTPGNLLEELRTFEGGVGFYSLRGLAKWLTAAL